MSIKKKKKSNAGRPKGHPKIKLGITILEPIHAELVNLSMSSNHLSVQEYINEILIKHVNNEVS